MSREEDPRKVAVLSLHTSPLDAPGTGDAGGMNVAIREVAERLARQGVQVDVFTRARGGASGRPAERELAPGARVIEVPAGPEGAMAKEDLPDLLPAFLNGVVERAEHEHDPYDVVHSHYWLSGWVGQATKQIWGAPLVASFHTLGRVKNAAGAEPHEPDRRLDGEAGVVDGADAIVAPTPGEADDLVGLYGADRGRIRVIPPGVNHSIFFPRDREEAKRRLHLSGARLVLFVGRLQAHKGPDVAVRALAAAVAADPEAMRDVVLAVVGGPSGRSGERSVGRLMDLIVELGVSDRVILLPPQPQLRLADFYAAADVVLVPSRSESFGLVALEAQACGTPVVAADVGGLRYVVDHGRTGFLVPGRDPEAYAEAMLRLLRDRRAARRMGHAATVHALRFSWEATARRTLDVYRELTRGGTG
jgi:D-inositol-3-phosphate glycosyltransferase